MSAEFIESPLGYKLAYHYTKSKVADAPCVVFLGGFRSDMSGTKALYLEGLAKDQGFAYLRLDYGGHGESGGIFEAGSIKTWFEDALHVINTLTSGDLIVIGSSMGGWISYLVAEAIPERVKALISIAPAPDFTDEFLDNMSPEQTQMYQSKGYFTAPNAYSDEPYIFSKTLIEDSRACFLLKKGIAYEGKVHILQGRLDDVVPWKKAELIKSRFASKDVKITYVEDGDHSLSRPQDLELLKQTIGGLTACNVKN